MNRLELSTTNGEKTLLHKGHPVKSTSKDDAFLTFIDFIENVKSTANTTIIPVLIGHNASVFDVPIFLWSLTQGNIHALKELNVHFGDSLLLVKQILKAQHPALCMASTGTFCHTALESLYSTLFDESFPAHDTTEDVKALRKVLFQSKLNLTKEMIISKSNVMLVDSAMDQLQYNDSCYIRLQTFSSKLVPSSRRQSDINESHGQQDNNKWNNVPRSLDFVWTNRKRGTCCYP